MKRKEAIKYLVESAKWQNNAIQILLEQGGQDRTGNPTPPPPPPPGDDD